MTNKLVVVINSLKVPKIKNILLYEMKFLVRNYSCLQNPWPGGYHPQIPILHPQLNLLNPPPNKIPGYATVFVKGTWYTTYCPFETILHHAMYPPLLNDCDSQHPALLQSLSLISPIFLSLSFPTSIFKSLMLPCTQRLITWPLTTASLGQDPSCSCLPCMIIHLLCWVPSVQL